MPNSPALPSSPCSPSSPWCPWVQAAPGDALVARLESLRPELSVQAVRETALDGVLALELHNGSVVYGTADGRFLFTGDMYAVQSDKFLNLTDSIRAERRRLLFADVHKDDLIVFPADGERKAYVNVFTDVDCGLLSKTAPGDGRPERSGH